MPQISNQDIYNQDDTLSMNDYTIGSNSNTGNKRTQTYTFGSIFSLFYNYLGFNAFLNTTDTTTYPIGTPGCFYVFDENDNFTSDFSQAKKITFSQFDTYSFDVFEYFSIIVNSGKFLFKLINLEDKNNFVFLAPSNFILGETGTTFEININLQEGLSNGTFVNNKRYLLVLEFASVIFNPGNYDLTDFTNNSVNPFLRLQDIPFKIIAQNLTDSAAVTGTTAVTTIETFTIPANTFQVGDRLIFTCRILKPISTGQTQHQHTIGGGVGSGSFGVFSSTSGTTYSQVTKELIIKSETLTEGLGGNMNTTTSDVNYNAGILSNLQKNINWSIDQYLRIRLVNQFTTDQAYVSFWQLIRIRP